MNHIGTIILETDRLILRRFTIDDAEKMFDNWASDDEVTKYLTWPTHQNVEMTMGYINYCIQEYAKPAFYQWIIEIKEIHEPIGSISVVKVIDELDSLELGWVIGRKYWGKGWPARASPSLAWSSYRCCPACSPSDRTPLKSSSPPAHSGRG